METFTGTNFDAEVLKSEKPVLVDFGAESWCAPCRALAPVLEEVSKEFDGQMRFGKIDIDNEDGLTSQYNIMAVPTLIIFKGGKPVAEMTGAKSREELISFVKEGL